MGKTLTKIAIGGALIGAAFLTGGASIIPGFTAASGATYGALLSTTALGSALIGLGATTALGGVAQAFAKTPKASLSAIERLNASVNPSAPRKVVFGRTAMATDIRYIEPSGSEQEHVDYIIAVAAHRVSSIEEIWLEDLLAWRPAQGGVLGKYQGYLTVDVRLEGGAGNAIPINGGAKWGAAQRLTGCAYIHLRIKRTGNSKKAESPFVSGLPSRMTIVGDGMPVYDPRFDDTVQGGSGGQRAANPATWAFRAGGLQQGINPALQILAHLLGWRINGGLSVGCGVPAARIDLTSFATAANLCDEPVLRADGSYISRFTAAGVTSEADDPQAILGTLLAACNGRLRDVGGKLSLWIAHNDLGPA